MPWNNIPNRTSLFGPFAIYYDSYPIGIPGFTETSVGYVEQHRTDGKVVLFLGTLIDENLPVLRMRQALEFLFLRSGELNDLTPVQLLTRLHTFFAGRSAEGWGAVDCVATRLDLVNRLGRVYPAGQYPIPVEDMTESRWQWLKALHGPRLGIACSGMSTPVTFPTSRDLIFRRGNTLLKLNSGYTDARNRNPPCLRYAVDPSEGLFPTLDSLPPASKQAQVMDTVTGSCAAFSRGFPRKDAAGAAIQLQR